MRLSNIPILSTKPLGNDLLHAAEENGFLIDVVRFIRTEPIQTDELTTRIQQLSSRKITAVFTSMNASEAVIRQLSGTKPLWKIFCLGSATARPLIQYFGETAIAGFANSASALAHTVIDAGNVRDAVFFCGDQRRDELPSILAAKQIHVEEVIVYYTIPVINKINQEYGGILFFSPSAASKFFTDNSIPVHTILFAIGETTAATIRKYSNNPIIVADKPTTEVLVNKMINYFQSSDQQKLLTETKE